MSISLITCRLIPLNKNPGVKPLGKDEISKRVVSKITNWVLKDLMQKAVGSLHTATGLKAGAEAAIHAMRTIFEEPSTEDVILVDANNAPNSLNRKVAFHNIQLACSSFSHILINTYRTSSRMIIMGGAEIQPPPKVQNKAII